MIFEIQICVTKIQHILQTIWTIFVILKFGLNIKLVFSKIWIFEMKNHFLQNLYKYKNMILKQIWSILYMDRIQYTYKIYIYVLDMKFKIG